MKKLLIALALLLIPASASAQCSGVFEAGTLCGAPVKGPPKQTTIGAIGGVSGPATSVIGNIAFWNNTTGTLLGAAPAFQSANPANSAIYSQMPNIANGYTTIFNGFQFSLGTPITAIGQFGRNTVGVQQALVGTLQIAAGDTAGNAGQAVTGYGITNSAGTGVVGVAGISTCGINNSNCWASAFSVNNSILGGLAPNTGVDIASMFGAEIDINVEKKAGGVEPTVGNLWGIYVIGAGDSTGTYGFGVAVDKLSTITNAKWVASFTSLPGASNIALAASTVATGASQASQTIQFNGTNAASASKSASIFASLDGNFTISGSGFGISATWDNATGVMGLPSLTASRLVVTDASKNLSSLAAGTTTTVLHGNAAGAASFGAVVSADMNITTTTCTNQFVNAISAGGVGTCATVTAAMVGSGAALTKTDDTNVTLTLGGSPTTALLAATSLTLGWTGQLGLTRGGTAASLTASNGGIFYSTASAGAILSGTATARQMLQSGASTTPAWSTTTWPATTTVNRILWSSAANVISDLATANSSILVTDSGGIPSLSTTLPAHTLGGTISGGGNQINNVIIGTTTPLAAAFTVVGIGTTSPTSGLDIVSGSAAAVSFRISDVTTNATNKIGRWTARQFTNADTDFLILDARGLTGATELNIGGGSGALNALTQLRIYTAANNTTLTGTSRFEINSTGVVSMLAGVTSTSKTTGTLVVTGGLGNSGAHFTDTLSVITMASDTAQVDNTVCINSSGLTFKGTGALGICLGTSGAQFKTAFAPMVGGVDDIARLNFQNYRYRDGFGDGGARMQYGLTAQDVGTVLPDLVRYDATGTPINFDSGALLFIGLKAIQQLKADNDNIETRLSKLENRK